MDLRNRRQPAHSFLSYAYWLYHTELFRPTRVPGICSVATEGGQNDNQLQVASKNGRLEVARFLFKNGANVNAEGGYHSTALQAASARGYEEIVILLLEIGANVNAEGGEHGTALQAASSNGHEKIVKLLLANR